MKEQIMNFFREEDGMETIEMVIILVILVGIAFAFRKTLLNWYTRFVTEAVETSPVGIPISPEAPGNGQ